MQRPEDTHRHPATPLRSGYVLVDKPSGPSSHAAVQQVRRALGIGGRRGTKAGHAGTLDPFASGLLVVLIGSATRLMPFVVGHDKRYLVDVRFGASSTTDDREGELTPTDAARPERARVEQALATLAAVTEQVPPAVSAIHVDGRRAYQRVRRGEVVDVPARPVRFDSIELMDWREPAAGEEGPTARLDVRCGSGTYMRALARDLGEAVGCSAYCVELRRSEVGDLALDGDAAAPAPDEVRIEHVRDARELLQIPELVLDAVGLAHVAAGRRIPLPRALVDAAHVALVAPDGSLAGIARPTSDAALLQPTAVFVTQPTAARPARIGPVNDLDTTRPVIALGTFDGVHRGHRSMLELARTAAAPDARPVVAMTFDPHPRAVVAGGAPPLLCSIEERVERIVAAGAERVEVVPFTQAFSTLSPAEFVDDWLVGRLRAASVVVGHNFRFGHRAAGDVTTLRELCAAHGVDVVVCDLLVDGDQAVSSSRIRRLLVGGNVEIANQLLGFAYDLEATVEHGARRGRELGMPTANLGVPATRLVPADGVYGGVATLQGTRWPAATSVGTNPQFTADQAHPPRTVEVHLIGYEGPDFYGEQLHVDFEQHIRGQQTFDSVEQLVEQMQQDLKDVQAGLDARSSLA